MKNLFLTLILLLPLSACVRETARDGYEVSINQPEGKYGFRVKASDSSYRHHDAKYISVVLDYAKSGALKEIKDYYEKVEKVEAAMLVVAKQEASKVCDGKDGFEEISKDYTDWDDCNTNEPITSTLCLVATTTEKVIAPTIPDWLDYYYRCKK